MVNTIEVKFEVTRSNAKPARVNDVRGDHDVLYYWHFRKVRMATPKNIYELFTLQATIQNEGWVI